MSSESSRLVRSTRARGSVKQQHVLNVSRETHALTVVDLADPRPKPRVLTSHFDEVWSLTGNERSITLFSTSRQAERFEFSMWGIGQRGMGDGEELCITAFVPDQDAVLSDAAMEGGRLRHLSEVLGDVCGISTGKDCHGGLFSISNQHGRLICRRDLRKVSCPG